MPDLRTCKEHGEFVQLMMKIIALALAIAGQLVMAADRLPKADRIPDPPMQDQISSIRQGVALHEQGDYEGAIATYKRVLDENPWEIHALYEMSLSYSANKQHEDALATALRGAECKSDHLAQFHIMIGNSLFNLGKTNEAVEVYRAAIKLNPRDALLHYNLATILARIGKPSDAKTETEESIRCDSSQASSHLFLAVLYRDMGYRMPAVMAYSRFLLLEPGSQRAMQALASLERLIAWGARVTKEPGNQNEIDIAVNGPNQKLVDEGNFATIEIAMSMLVAMDNKKGATEAASEFERLVHVYKMIGGAFTSSKPKGGFAATYYAPYFVALAKGDRVEAFVAEAWKPGRLVGASDWVAANPSKIAAFRAWSEQYAWPAK